MNTEFPKVENQFLKASDFQDTEISLHYKGWKKKPNEDVEKKDGSTISWKTRIKYQLRFSYPEWALDEAGEKKLDSNGNQIKNRNYDPKYPQGYSISYIFEEGTLDSGSLPLFNAFCLVQPKPGDVISIKRTGEQQDTKWIVKKNERGTVHAPAGKNDEVPEVNFDEDDLIPDEEIPF